MNTATERRWWKAATRRDPSFDAAFVFGVLTTGIYCRPTCPARRPLAKNVQLFSTSRAAEREGFRACKRCRPESGSRPAVDTRLAARAGAFLRRHVEERITLETMARSLAVSPHHLQRMFKRALGISPRTYLSVLRFEQFRKGAGITGAGFGSSSRLYERARSRLGMTPAAALNGGSGMSIVYDFFDCSLGRALIAATPLGICAVEFGDSDKLLARSLGARYPRAAIRRSTELLRRAAAQLRRIFAGKPVDPTLPLDVRATAFQARVWSELRSIPAGATRSYGDIARRIGRPGSARAVGRACASNRIAVLIPCHRAIGASGDVTGYRWGKERKKTLLALERDAST